MKIITPLLIWILFLALFVASPKYDSIISLIGFLSIMISGFMLVNYYQRH